MRSRIFALLLIAAPLAWPAGAPSAAQSAPQVDPFYARSLATGEAQFRSKAFGPAAASLEIAAFGLHPRPADLGRARLLLGLCRSFLGAKDRIEADLRSAVSLLGPTGLAQAELPDWARTELAKLVKAYKIDVSAPPTAALSAAPAPKPRSVLQAVEAPRPAPPAATRAELERIIRNQPRQAEAYVALAGLHEAAGDVRSARRVYQDLLTKVPNEIRAYLEIGRLLYLERAAKDAERWLERFLGFAADMPVDPGNAALAKAYLVLCAVQRSDAAAARSRLKLKPDLDESLVRSLPLRPADRDRLLRLLGR